jgi:hypothetical protein
MLTRSPLALRLALMGLATALLFPAAAVAKTVAYRGQLMGADGHPYFGMVRLTFALHRDAKGGKPLWSETQFLFVEEGSFLVTLGSRNAIPDEIAFDGAYVSLAVPKGPEFFREGLKPLRVVTTTEFAAMKESAEAPMTVVNPSPLAKPAPAAGGTSSSYAEKAGMAYEAEHARNADKLENMTLKEIERALRDRTKPKLGDGEAYADHVGGYGGTPFSTGCPKGYVVTGVRGGAGKFIDGFQFVCSPLE